MTRAQVLDAAKRAGHTFWQAFLAALAVAWAASGLDISQIVDVDSAKRFGVALAGAVAAALLSAAKSTVVAIVTNPGGYIGRHRTTTTSQGA